MLAGLPRAEAQDVTVKVSATIGRTDPRWSGGRTGAGCWGGTLDPLARLAAEYVFRRLLPR